jgi:uncharacterized membrane protein
MHDAKETRESNLRSVTKALTYRITGTLTTMAITFVVTGQAAAALAVGGIEPVVKIIVYYVHERAWARVPIGTVRGKVARIRQGLHDALGDGRHEAMEHDAAGTDSGSLREPAGRRPEPVERSGRGTP